MAAPLKAKERPEKLSAFRHVGGVRFFSRAKTPQVSRHAALADLRPVDIVPRDENNAAQAVLVRQIDEPVGAVLASCCKPQITPSVVKSIPVYMVNKDVAVKNAKNHTVHQKRRSFAVAGGGRFGVASASMRVIEQAPFNVGHQSDVCVINHCAATLRKRDFNQACSSGIARWQ